MKPFVETSFKLGGAVLFGAYAALVGAVLPYGGIQKIMPAYLRYKEIKNKMTLSDSEDKRVTYDTTDLGAIQLCIGITFCLAACSAHCTMGLFGRSLLTSTTAFYSTAAFGAGAFPLMVALDTCCKDTQDKVFFYLGLSTLRIAYCVEKVVMVTMGYGT
jgi:hypothetical protein